MVDSVARLKFETQVANNAEVDQLIGRLDGVVNRIDKFKNNLRGGEAGLGGWSTALKRASVSQSGYNRELQTGISLLDKYRQAKEHAANIPDPIGGGSRSHTIGTGATRLAALSSQLGLQLPAEGLRLVDDIADLTAIMGPAGIAVAGFGAGMAALNAALEPGRQASRNYAENIGLLNEILITGTRESLQAARDNTAARLQIERLNLEAERRRVTEIAEGFREAFGIFGDQAVGSAFLLNTEGINDLKAAAEGSSAEIGRLEELLALLDAAVAQNATAAQDAAAAEQALAEARQVNFDRLIQNEIRVLSNIPRSTEALEDRLEQINREQEVLREYLDTAGLSVEATDELRRRLTELGSEESLLSITLRPLVEARQREIDAAELAKEKEENLARSRERAAVEAERLGEQIADLEARSVKIEADSKAKISSLLDDLNDKLADAVRDRDKALADADKEAAEGREEAKAQAREDEIKAELEHQRNLQKIERDYNRSAAQAIQDRNAVALDAAQQARDDALSDEKQSYDDSRKAISDQLKKTNAEIDKRLREQRNTAIERYNEQIRIARDAAAKAIQLERDKARAEIAANQQRINELTIQQRAYNLAANNLAKEGSQNLLATHQAFWQAAVGLANQAVHAAKGTSASSAPAPRMDSGKHGRRSFDSGPPTVFTRREDIRVGPGDLIIPPGNRFGGINVSVNGVGMNKQQVIQTVVDKLYEAWAEDGAA